MGNTQVSFFSPAARPSGPRTVRVVGVVVVGGAAMMLTYTYFGLINSFWSGILYTSKFFICVYGFVNSLQGGIHPARLLKFLPQTSKMIAKSTVFSAVFRTKSVLVY